MRWLVGTAPIGFRSAGPCRRLAHQVMLKFKMHHLALDKCVRMLLVMWIHALPKLSGLGSLPDAFKRLTCVLRWHVDEGKIDFFVVERIVENEIHSDHRGSPPRISLLQSSQPAP